MWQNARISAWQLLGASLALLGSQLGNFGASLATFRPEYLTSVGTKSNKCQLGTFPKSVQSLYSTIGHLQPKFLKTFWTQGRQVFRRQVFPITTTTTTTTLSIYRMRFLCYLLLLLLLLLDVPRYQKHLSLKVATRRGPHHAPHSPTA